MAQGDLESAAAALDEAHHIVQHPPPSRWMTWRYATHCYVSLGELAFARGDLARAASWADQSLEIATPTRSRKYESRAWRLKGDVATLRRTWDDAEQFLHRASSIADEIAEPRSRWHALAAIGRYALVRGRRDDARRAYATASEIVDRIVIKVADAALRAGLEQSAVVREIRAQGRP